MSQGKINEALREANTVAQLDPLSSSAFSLQARWTFFSRRYNEADQLADVLLTRDPDNMTAAWHLAHSFFFGGHPEKTVGLLPDRSVDSLSTVPGLGARSAQLLSLAGEADSARVVVDRYLSRRGAQYLDPDEVWPTYAILGDLDQALIWMERSIEGQSPSAKHIGVIPLADPLRDDPRYEQLLRKLNLPEDAIQRHLAMPEETP